MLILASQSEIRRDILSNAGVPFQTRASTLDERAEVDKHGGEETFSAPELAMILAKAKALNVDQGAPENSFIIGCDQILGLDNQILHKAKTMAEAKTRLQALAGKTHALHGAIALVQNGKTIWTHSATAKLKMRALTNDDIDAYLQTVNHDILASVGCYQLEGVGAALFEAIEGDIFTIMGLSLLPLLSALKDHAHIDPIYGTKTSS